MINFPASTDLRALQSKNEDHRSDEELNLQYLRVHVVLQDYPGLSGDFWLEVFDELLPVVVDEPENSLCQDGFAGLEELSGTAATIIFRKQTFHLNVYIVEVEVEVECGGF